MDKLFGGTAFHYSLDMTDPDTNIPSNCFLIVKMKYLRAVKGCYLFHHFANTDNGTTGTWRQGQEECERLGGYLVEITTEQQQMFLVCNNIQKTPHNLYCDRSTLPRRRSSKATQMFGTLASVTRVMRAGQLRSFNEMRVGY